MEWESDLWNQMDNREPDYWNQYNLNLEDTCIADNFGEH